MAAIYMWFEPPEYTVLTTTLYPIDANDSMDMMVSLLSGSMGLLPESDIDIGHNVEDGMTAM